MNTSPWPVCFRAVGIACVLIAVVLMSGCQTTRTVVEVRERKIEVPKSLLTCSSEPVAGKTWVSQKDIGKFMVRLAEAGQDCRLKLAAVRKLVEEAQ